MANNSKSDANKEKSHPHHHGKDGLEPLVNRHQSVSIYAISDKDMDGSSMDWSESLSVDSKLLVQVNAVEEDYSDFLAEINQDIEERQQKNI